MPRKSLTPIPVAPVERIMSASGAKRVSAAGAERMAQELSDIAHNISESAVKIAKHSGRKTVKARDIRLAFDTGSF